MTTSNPLPLAPWSLVRIGIQSRGWKFCTTTCDATQVMFMPPPFSRDFLTEKRRISHVFLPVVDVTKAILRSIPAEPAIATWQFLGMATYATRGRPESLGTWLMLRQSTIGSEAQSSTIYRLQIYNLSPGAVRCGAVGAPRHLPPDRLSRTPPQDYFDNLQFSLEHIPSWEIERVS
ncbi:hypothetical protein SODALDRAFT_360866 [Sodiomyces alkalinus F11]|uniref:Uncharacterized protein n=1 Tax=Sodiomyces alkalinus (strain CBS 110278 / VKM F-3762 / F11) TaxID=1314773 RepID=A0A3N2PRU0_SODAK|nr:hypothetical protein SODALDRAFT_360866 [Sodiomyces alkalinus F11]ROT37180.1 hypothetical protein SODALDRAFT_360866 [Sodiomyces alkalinus F11]